MTASSVQIASVLIVDDSYVQRGHAVTICGELGIEKIHEGCPAH